MSILDTIKWSLLIIAVIYVNIVSYQSFMNVNKKSRKPASEAVTQTTNSESYYIQK